VLCRYKRRKFVGRTLIECTRAVCMATGFASVFSLLPLTGVGEFRRVRPLICNR